MLTLGEQADYFITNYRWHPSGLSLSKGEKSIFHKHSEQRDMFCLEIALRGRPWIRSVSSFLFIMKLPGFPADEFLEFLQRDQETSFCLVE